MSLRRARLKQVRRQRRIAELAVEDVRRAAKRGLRAAANMVVRYQAASIAATLDSINEILDEQGVPNQAAGAVNRTSLLSDPLALAQMMSNVQAPYALDRFTETFVHDAGRTTSTVAFAANPRIRGYIRIVGGTCCARCAVLSGRIYSCSTGFLRHSSCRCTMEPWFGDSRPDIPTPLDLFNSGLITDLSRADTRAINDGADIGQVVNSHRQAAGLSVQSTVIKGTKFNFTTEGTTRRGLYGKSGSAARAMEKVPGQKYLRTTKSRLTPETIMRVASDRDHAIRLLEHYGYIL